MIALLAGLLVGLSALPALAISCSNWSRLAPDQKQQAIDDMIQSAITGQRGRQYQVNRRAIERCLYGQASNIELDFDDACADSRTASMQALNRIFKEYIWSCVE